MVIVKEFFRISNKEEVEICFDNFYYILIDSDGSVRKLLREISVFCGILVVGRILFVRGFFY